MFRHLRASAGAAAVAALLGTAACAPKDQTEPAPASPMQALVDQYATVRLTADLSHLSDNDKQVVRLLIEAVQQMDPIFWQETYGDETDALALANGDEATRRYIEINFGPWDRLRDNEPFIDGVGPEARGREPVSQGHDQGGVRGRRGEQPRPRRASTRWCGAPTTARSPRCPTTWRSPRSTPPPPPSCARPPSCPATPTSRKYLDLRADALESDEYQASDFAWMDMKNNPIDVVIGPIETYEDALFGYKAGHEGYVLIKDQEWSDRLARFAALPARPAEGAPRGSEVQGGDPGHRRRPERLRRGLLRR